MIYGNIKYPFINLDVQIKKCLAYIESENLFEKEIGSYEIDNKDLFVNIVTYETAPSDNKEWEAHKKYVDLHYMLEGKEQIDFNFIDHMVQQPYNEEEDYLPLAGEKSASIVLRTGEYAVCFPKDAHKPGIQVGASATIKKAIFKIRIQ